MSTAGRRAPADPSAWLIEAADLDAAEPLHHHRHEFTVPTGPDGTPQIYLAGNSLGLVGRRSREQVALELDRWGTLGVAGHFTGDEGWAGYHRLLTAPMARLVGAEPEEVVVMNSLTTNLHLLLVSFYRPTPTRHRILIEQHAFPSDHFAVESQIRQRGLDPATSLVTVGPRPGEDLLRPEDLVAAIEAEGDALATVLLPGVHYYTGQVLPLAEITAAAHRVGATVGFDLAHAVGNVTLDLHDLGADFAAWCTYKYLNAGPGAVGGAFVHHRNLGRTDLPRLTGWWGTNPETRFEMACVFDPVPTVEAWQLSNAPILSMAALRGSLELFDEIGLPALRARATRLLAFADRLLGSLAGAVEVITPTHPDERGCQLSLRLGDTARGPAVHRALEAAGVACDWRHPDVIRVAPVPLYNSHDDIARFVAVLARVVAAR
ncbi:MAG: kynureninase [Acidimicrobiales bacterium]